MKTLTRVEAFAAMERGEDVQVLVKTVDDGKESMQWHKAHYGSFYYKGQQFRLKPNPRKAREFWVQKFSHGLAISHPGFQGAFKVREVIPGDITGREALDWVLEEMQLHRSTPHMLIQAVEAKRDSLPE